MDLFLILYTVNGIDADDYEAKSKAEQQQGSLGI